ncbi:MAG: hypothetical protein ABEH90_01260, partial [Halolamina sp.]
MDRRRFLTSASGLLLFTGGCSQPADSTATAQTATTDSPTGTATDTPTATSTPPTPGPVSLEPGEPFTSADGFAVTLENVAVQVAIIEFGTAHNDPLYRDGEQFVVADVAVSGDERPDPADLHVFLHTDTLTERRRYYVAADSNEDDVRQRFGYPVPVSPLPTEGAVVWTRDGHPDVRWELSADVRSAIS